MYAENLYNFHGLSETATIYATTAVLFLIIIIVAVIRIVIYVSTFVTADVVVVTNIWAEQTEQVATLISK